MGSAPSTRQSGGPGGTTTGNTVSVREYSNREPTVHAGWGPDSPAGRQALTPRLPRAHFAEVASPPSRTMRGKCSPRSNSESTVRRASPSRLPRRHWATGASAPRLETRGIYSALSNREPLGLEILQLVENKHHRPVLIANFEPSCTRHFRPIP